jgi:AcrR family transcriptional regulator
MMRVTEEVAMAKQKTPKRQRSRADGELSRTRILDAATEIAAERGYEGTSIALVSAKCGLPASSIYWHFKDKDDLIAAVIERSFGAWLAAWQVPEVPEQISDQDAEQYVVGLLAETAKALADCPDFLRLGLMLGLERRPVEPRARTMFLQVRARAFEELIVDFRKFLPGLTAAEAQQLVLYGVAGADGLFIAKEIGGDAVDLLALFEMHGQAIYHLGRRMIEKRMAR